MNSCQHSVQAIILQQAPAVQAMTRSNATAVNPATVQQQSSNNPATIQQRSNSSPAEVPQQHCAQALEFCAPPLNSAMTSRPFKSLPSWLFCCCRSIDADLFLTAVLRARRSSFVSLLGGFASSWGVRKRTSDLLGSLRVEPSVITSDYTNETK